MYTLKEAIQNEIVAWRWGHRCGTESDIRRSAGLPCSAVIFGPIVVSGRIFGTHSAKDTGPCQCEPMI